jgi:hypothetical protein
MALSAPGDVMTDTGRNAFSTITQIKKIKTVMGIEEKYEGRRESRVR